MFSCNFLRTKSRLNEESRSAIWIILSVLVVKRTQSIYIYIFFLGGGGRKARYRCVGNVDVTLSHVWFIFSKNKRKKQTNKQRNKETKKETKKESSS